MHLHTPPLETEVIYQNKEERCVSMAYMAMAAAETQVEILAYALMSNHFHFIVIGERVMEFFQNFKERLSVYLSRHGRRGIMKNVSARETVITSLKQFQNELIYVIRNPYVVSAEVNLLSYPWCSGYLYFNRLRLSARS